MSSGWRCVEGHDVAIGDRTCPECGGDVVWEAGPGAAGATPDRPTAPGEQQTAWGWILVGFVVAVVGWAVVAAAADDGDRDVLVFGGYVVAALGSVVTAIGVVAEGVRIGRNLSR
ncbi:hypothetical protein [Nocardioides marinquilinus]|uniref:hypothetical protein n=1 Tax=Nocardioides marinquilinus TaxID=1210400 RepID=UPI0031EE2018